MCYPIIIRKQEFPVTIREKRTPISQFAAALRQRSPQEKRDLLVADTLDSLCRHCDLYDAARVSSNPFHPELLRTIAAADLSSEALFSLFECLAVLVHLPNWPIRPSRWTRPRKSCCSSSSTAGNGCRMTRPS